MSKLLRTITSLGVVALAGLTPVASYAAATGTSLCGNSGKELCVTLAAARGSADVPQTHPFIGKYVVDHAKPAGKNVWKGSMTVQGNTMNGTLTLNPGVNFVMHGCAYVVICSDFTLIPAQ
jgi:hypothetical protein